MESTLLELLDTLNGKILWGPPTLILLVGTGVWLTIRLVVIQVRELPHALWLAFVRRKDPGEGDISHYQALMTALSATVGTGNIVGVTTAIALGGPGALFWMWITGAFGMATKFAEAVLGVRYRIRSADGEMSGGPMYYLRDGFPHRRTGAVLGGAFAVFAAFAAFGIGNLVQSNAVAATLGATLGAPAAGTGAVLMLLAGAVVIGGIRSIGRVTSVLVPAMILLYVGSCLLILATHASAIPEALALVFRGAFTGTAASGGFAGATLAQAIRFGVARGVFSNESGIGSGGIAAAAATTEIPVRQGLVSMTQTFLDTIVICTMTGLVLLVTGAWTGDGPAGDIVTNAFARGLPGGSGGLVVAICLALFAFSTILGWGYYGEKSFSYLFGDAAARPYRLVFVLAIFPGAVFQMELVWSVSDAMNALMAIPNLIGLVALSGVVAAETRAYAADRRISDSGH